MKKLCLMLLIAISCSVSAKAPLESDSVNTFDYFKVSQTANTSSVLNELKGEQNKAGQSCIQTCLSNYRYCLATAQGTSQVRGCESSFEACMVGCGI